MPSEVASRSYERVTASDARARAAASTRPRARATKCHPAQNFASSGSPNPTLGQAQRAKRTPLKSCKRILASDAWQGSITPQGLLPKRRAPKSTSSLGACVPWAQAATWRNGLPRAGHRIRRSGRHRVPSGYPFKCRERVTASDARAGSTISTERAPKKRGEPH